MDLASYLLNIAQAKSPEFFESLNLGTIPNNFNLPFDLPNSVTSTPLLEFFLVPLILSLQKDPNAPKTKLTFRERYDYIVVGGGSGGSTVAGRLSEIPNISVLLLEYGPKAPALNDVPVLARNFVFTDIDWQYKTVPQNHAGNGLVNRQVVHPSGKGLGGSSLLNAMLDVRCNRKDYDRWAANGATGWSYDDIFKYFLKLEGNLNLSGEYHNTSGPVTCEFVRYHSPMTKAILKTAKELGYNVVDSNAEHQSGFTRIQTTTRRGQRCSAAKAYLVPAEDRPNLDILTAVFVKKVLIENKKAIGVLADYGGCEYKIYAEKEVIISAGANRSPQILMLSGIGPKKQLEEHGIEVVMDLPVGENFQDHPFPFLSYVLEKTQPLVLQIANPVNIAKYHNKREGILCLPSAVTAINFLNGTSSDQTSDDPQFENQYIQFPLTTSLTKKHLGITDEVYEKVFKPYENKTTMFCGSTLLRPSSIGTVKLRSANPYDDPLLDPNFFAYDRDIKNSIDGLKLCRKIANSKRLHRFGMKEFETLVPGCEDLVKDEDKYLECLIKSYFITISHPCCSVKMGDPCDPTTVLDPELRVIGIKSLRVADASIFPDIPAGNTNVPTIMVGEKAADMIKEAMNRKD